MRRHPEILGACDGDGQRTAARRLTVGLGLGHEVLMEAREKIITTAVRLFSAQGYANTSLSQVAKDAEVSKALIFWHFDNKETLFRTAVQRTLEPYFINVLDDLAGLSEVDQIKRLIDEYYAFVSKNVYSVKFFLSLILRDEKHPDDLIGAHGRAPARLPESARRHPRERPPEGHSSAKTSRRSSTPVSS